MPEYENKNLNRRGLTQLKFLESVPQDLLTEKAYKKLIELRHKFPQFEIGVPISTEAKFVDELF